MTMPTIQPQPLTRRAAPWRITFDTNPDDCNLRCVMCEEHSEYSPQKQIRIRNRIAHRRMPIDTIARVIAECAPRGLREIIPSTMGEPLLYKEMPRIIALCHEHSVKMNLTTNGTFPRLGAQRWAELITPIGSDIKISWNGADAGAQCAVMAGNDFDKGVDNLRTLIRVREQVAAQGGNYCSVTLQMTFMEMNLKQIPRVVEFAIAERVDRVKGHHLWAHFKEIANQDLRRNADSIHRWNAVAQECQRIAAQHRLPNGKRIRLQNMHELDANHQNGAPPSAICPFLGKEAWVNYEGRFDPCCAPDKLRRTLGDFGNVSAGGLFPIWNSAAYQNLLTNYMQYDVCQRCNMRQLPQKTA